MIEARVLVLVLDRDLFLRLDRLVQPVGPAPADHQAPGELVDDDDFAVLHHVVLVAVEKMVRAERRVQMVDQIDVRRLVQARARRQQADVRQDLFRFLVAGLRQDDLVVLLVHVEVAWRLRVVGLFFSCAWRVRSSATWFILW